MGVAHTGHCFVSRKYREQFAMVVELSQSFAVDNAAFTAWKSGNPITDWSDFYAWVEQIYRYPNFDFAVIPDVIDGDEAANDALLDEWPFALHIGAPVWHLHESLARLGGLVAKYPRICIGSSAQFSKIGTPAWWTRMTQAMDVICNEDGLPNCKLHGLRMLNPKVFSLFPFASADSCNIAMNVPIDKAWTGSYKPTNKAARAIVMRQIIESTQSSGGWNRDLAKTRLDDIYSNMSADHWQSVGETIVLT